MNFLDATLGKDGDAYTINFGKYSIKIPASKAEGIDLESYVGKEVVFGIRPENVHDEPEFLEKVTDGIVDADVEVAPS